ncbi:hypothetical protein J8J14_21155 [Roseomonas sp. SSH11]|uniref:Uncharacterized protein n=1 Tax=Pararoseomonas baculiformis TaxID=2820812 RepID=A0ABS4AJR7_9PROT|nr:hypothetical protein [Pararoseomonas baculiformis]MBP0447284.1 hypothetical protein [Pararoseomonas baculiformis]
MDEHDLRWAIHDACQAIYIATSRGVSQVEIKQLIARLECLDEQAFRREMKFHALRPCGEGSKPGSVLGDGLSGRVPG